jgi:hypothetical protein
MGCNPIYAVGFTLKTGSSYFYGSTNPVTRRSTIYQADRAIEWCLWYQRQFPGRVLLDPSFDGPIYSVFKKTDFNERQASSGQSVADDRGHQPDAHRLDANQG